MRKVGPAAWWTAAAVLAAAPASAGPLVRVWAETRVAVQGRSVTDEAGARWIDVEGTVRTDRGEPVGRAAVRFVRHGGSGRAATDATGRFRARLRQVPGDPWVARYDGGERLRPSASPVGVAASDEPTRLGRLLPVLPAAGLAAVAAALVAAEALRRLRGRLRAAWRRLRGPAGKTAGAGIAGIRTAPDARRIRLVDRLRDHPLPSGWCRSPSEPESPIPCDPDGIAVLPSSAVRWEAGAPGYLPAPLAPDDGGETIRLLRGRDAISGTLERSREAVVPVGQPTVLALARAILPPEEAIRLARLCYGPPGPPPTGSGDVLERLWTATPAAQASCDEVLAALESESPDSARPAPAG